MPLDIGKMGADFAEMPAGFVEMGPDFTEMPADFVEVGTGTAEMPCHETAAARFAAGRKRLAIAVAARRFMMRTPLALHLKSPGAPRPQLRAPGLEIAGGTVFLIPSHPESSFHPRPSCLVRSLDIDCPK